MGRSRWSARCRKLHRMTGKELRWCREFLADFGAFTEVVARALRIPIREVDRGMALQLERVRLRADSGVTAEDLERGL